MLIAIDGRELCGRVTGVGRYLAHLLEAWDALPEAALHEFVLYLPAGAAYRPSVTSLRLSLNPLDGGSGTRWEQWSLPAALRRERPDVLFAPAYTAPILTRVPVVVTVHDLSFIAHPEWFAPRTRLRRRLVTTLAARRARRIVTVTEFSRGEIVKWLGVPATKVQVIPHGLPRPSRQCNNPGPRSAGAGLEPGVTAAAGQPGATVLYVGSVFNRRHVPELIRAFARVAPGHPQLRLEIVGDNRTYPPEDLPGVAAGAGVAEKVTIRSYVPDETLGALYASAAVFVFLSDYEGFGLTPLEALAAGVPVLVGDTAVAREVYGDAAAFVETTDVTAIAERLESLVVNGPARTALLDRAGGVLARYSWERAGRDTLATLLEAARA